MSTPEQTVAVRPQTDSALKQTVPRGISPSRIVCICEAELEEAEVFFILSKDMISFLLEKELDPVQVPSF